MAESADSSRPLLWIVLVGVALRMGFLFAAGDLELQSDEANYVYLALLWNHFGVYTDTTRYLWPPGYPFLLSQAFEWFELGGIFALKFIQVLASASIGWTIALFARSWFDLKTAKLATLSWALYLPLIGFTHYLWTETLFLALFLPALYQFQRALERAERGRADRHLIASGALFALALYIKEAPLYLSVLLVALLFVFRRSAPLEALRQASLFALTMGVLILPWTLRNYEVYGRVIPMGTTLGENCFGGLNAPYKNFDLTPFTRRYLGEIGPEDLSREWFIRADPESEWFRALEIMNTADRLAENRRRGIQYALDHPAWLVRTRVKKLADLAAPVSFFLRHVGLSRYEESPLALPGIRHVLVVWAVLCPVLVLALGLLGACVRFPRGAGAAVCASVFGYFLLSSLLVSMSRFRVPFVPFLIVLACAALTRRGERAGGLARVASVAGVAALCVLWWIDWPEISTIVRLAWNGGPA